LGGVLFMGLAIAILAILPFVDKSPSGLIEISYSRYLFWLFVLDVL
jgi:quinol-cytochrome oxidoreductase complex cytochrome b subunit